VEPPNWRAWEVYIRCDDFHGTCVDWPTAAAYTVNPGFRRDKKPQVTKDTIVICPKVFKSKPTCAAAIAKSGKSSERFDLNNFQCQGKLILPLVAMVSDTMRITNYG